MKIKLKLTFLFLFLIVTTSLTAQDFGYKKGIISVDKVEVARLNKTMKKEKNTEYLVSSLDNKPIIKLKEFWLGPNAYYKLTFLKDSSTADMLYELMTFTLNMDKSIAMLLVKQYKLFNKDGIDYGAVANMIASTKAQTDVAKKNQRIQDSLSAIVDVKQLDIIIQNWSVTSKGRIIGRIEAPDNFNWGFDIIKFYNSNNTLIGQTIPEQAVMDGKVKMTDGKILNVKTVNWNGTGFKYSQLQKIVRELAFAGYY